MMNTRTANSQDSRRQYLLAERKVRYRVGNKKFEILCPNCGSTDLWKYYEDNSLYCMECSYGKDIGKANENRYILGTPGPEPGQAGTYYGTGPKLRKKGE